MICTKCGTQNNDNDIFCAQCGAPLNAAGFVRQASPPPESFGGPYAHAARPRRKRKGLIIGIAAAVIVVAGAVTALLLIRPGFLGGGGSTIAVVHESSFSSPEAAIRHFVSSVAANNLSGALSACAVNEATKNYNVEASINRTEAITGNTPAPTQYAFDKALDQTYFLGSITGQIQFFTYSFVDSGVVKSTLNEGQYSTQSDPDAAEKFVKAVNPENIRGLKIVRIDEPVPSVLNSPQNVSSFKKLAQIYGANELTERVVLYELNGKYFCGGFHILRYGKSWKVLDLQSSVVDTSPSGTVQETTPDKYSKIRNGD